ncbi:MAG: pilus assembly protein [Chloroflexota bacterium]|nr:pilus assembly protein [Chloroflexota bacterium]
MESALVLPIFILLLLGVVQVTLYAHARDVLLGAAVEGARLAAEDGRTLEDGLARLADVARAGLGASVEPLQTSGRVDPELVEMRVETRLKPILPLPTRDGLPVHARASVSRERFRAGGGAP